MPDEAEQNEAKDRHGRTLALLRDLRGDAEYRLTEIINRNYDRQMDNAAEEREVRATVREDLVSLQRRIDQTLNSLK